MSDPNDRLLDEDLSTAWHFQREALVRDRLGRMWKSGWGVQVLDVVVGPLLPPHLDMFNKPTAIYFEQSSQVGQYDDVHRYTYLKTIFMAASYEAWRARCGDALDIEYGHFLANAIRITKQGPQNLSGIAAAHLRFCDMAKESGLEVDNYQLQVSYPAVVLVCDRIDIRSGKDDDGFINIRKITDELTALVMLTDASLANQITLDELDPHVLPLERSDAEGIDVRRVPLAVAVDFIVNLESRTRGPRKRTAEKYEKALSRVVAIPKGFDQSVVYDPQEWVAALKASYVPGSSECPPDIEEALQRIEARRSGVPCDFDFEHIGWAMRWKSGYDESSLASKGKA